MNRGAPQSRITLAILTGLLLSYASVAGTAACGQAAASRQAAMPTVGGCKPLSERTGETGCWIVLSQPLGQLPQTPVFWSLDLFPTHAAAEAAKGPHGIVTEALGKSWVFTIGDKAQRPAGGKPVAQIGPIPIKPGESYTAQFMEAVLPPGIPTRTHRHPGPEVFYTEAGESCLETPAGKQVGRPGVDVIIPEGPPMILMTSGTVTRRSIVLVLHSTSQPWMTMADDWTPKFLCRT